MPPTGAPIRPTSSHPHRAAPRTREVAAIAALAPDLVVANQEENRAADLDELRACGLAVYVTDIRTLDGAFGSLARMLAACGLDRPAWLDEARGGLGGGARSRPRGAGRWCRSGGGRGWRSGATRSPARCCTGSAWTTCSPAPRTATRGSHPDALPEHDLVVLPDEPYLFTADDGPEAFPDMPAALVSGRLLTWYGPSLTEAARTLPARPAPLTVGARDQARGGDDAAGELAACAVGVRRGPARGTARPAGAARPSPGRRRPGSARPPPR